MPTQSFVLGMNAASYQGTADAAIGALTIIDNIKDLTYTIEAGETDVTTRGNSGWRATGTTLRDFSADFDMVWEPADVSMTALRDAILNGTLLEMAILDQTRETSGAQGMKGNFSATTFSNAQALEEGQIVSITVKLTQFNEWVEVA